MKILFVGPSLYGSTEEGWLRGASDIVWSGPARQGDVARAVLEDAKVIGLIDGRYEDVAAPWHKEILFALERGVTVFGGASLGALRAAECAAYGMIGVGRIFEAYRDGARVDDADVAQLHGPAELGYMPVTEALVNIEATLGRLLRMGVIEPRMEQRLVTEARAIFFKDLSIEAVIEAIGGGEAMGEELLDLYRAHYVDQKRLDALALVEAMRVQPDELCRGAKSWILQTPAAWRGFIGSLETGS